MSIVFYHNDLDGHCAGAIVQKYIKENFSNTTLRFVEVDYAYDNYEVKALDFVQKHFNEVVYIVDFHFSAEVMKEMCLYAREIYVFDHHKSAAETIAKYPKEIHCHCDPESKSAGCELVWEFLYPNNATPLAVTLIADRDKWAWKYGRKTAKFTEGLHLYSNQPEDDETWEELLDDGDITNILREGDICLQYRDNKFKEFRNLWGYEVELEGYKCYVLNIMFLDGISEMFGDKLDEYDICIATVYKDGLWKISLRSNKVDVSKIAQKIGGGGHARAAGAENLTVLPWENKK